MLLAILFLFGLQPGLILHAKSYEQLPIQPIQDSSSSFEFNGLNHIIDKETQILWKFNFSSPAPHIFSSVNGLLQQWSNTFFPNGHSIVPCQIPPFTNLYHGRLDGELPENPEWVAFDIEMSYGIMGSGRNSHVLTYQTTKPAGCLYFDGESATLMGTGQMDTQMLFIYGNISGPSRNDNDGRRFRGLEDEYNRASGLCKWVQDKGLGGPGWGVEGIVRMNAGFEMIWCNFTSPSIRLLTRLNVTAPLLREVIDGKNDDKDEVFGLRNTGVSKADGTHNTSPAYYPLPTETSPPGHSKDPDQPPMPPSWRKDDSEPFLDSQTWGWFESATWHYGSTGMGAGRGETRLKPLTCGFLTFYNPAFPQQQAEIAATERVTLNLTVDGFWQGPGNDEHRTLALEQLMRRRRNHLLRNITESDVSFMHMAAERVLKSLNFDNVTNQRSGFHNIANCTGMDWIAVTNDIVQRYAPRLQHLKFRFDAAANLDMGNSTAVRNWFSRLREHVHFLLMPHYEYFPTPPPNSSEHNQDKKSPGRLLALSRCKYQYTRLIAPDLYNDGLSPEEALLTFAVEETLGGICSWVIDVGFAIESEWFSHFDSHRLTQRDHKSNFVDKIEMWKYGLEELMAWLGWIDQWTYCKEGCAWDEVCFIPMWPLDSIDKPSSRFSPGPGPGPGYGRGHYRSPNNRGSRVSYVAEEEFPQFPSKPPGGPGKPPPFGFVDDQFLWEPKCIKAEYVN